MSPVIFRIDVLTRWCYIVIVINGITVVDMVRSTMDKLIGNKVRSQADIDKIIRVIAFIGLIIIAGAIIICTGMDNTYPTYTNDNKSKEKTHIEDIATSKVKDFFEWQYYR